MKRVKEKILTKNFFYSCISLFLLALIMYMLMTTITEYAAANGAAVGLAGLASGIFIIGAIVSRLLAGQTMSKLGWKRTALISSAFHLISCSLYFFASDITPLLIVRFIHGFWFGATNSGVITIGLSLIPKSRYAEGCGYFMLAPTAAIAVGPFAGGLIIERYGAAGCFAATALAAALALVLMSLTDRKSIDLAEHSGEKKEVSGKGLGKILEVKAIPVSICIFLLAFGYSGLVSFLRLYGAAENLGESVSYFFVIFAVSSLLIRPFAGRLQDRRGDNIIMYPGIVTQAVGLFYLAWRPGVLSILICAIFCAIGYGTLNSSINAIVNRQAAPKRRAYAVSTFWLFCDCGMGLGPVLLGMVGASGGYRAIFYIAAVITAFTFPVYYFFWGRHAPPATENCS